MKVSVIIPCYNFEKYIKQCIDSVLLQETDFDLEIIVGDDHSKDGTLSVLESFSGRIKFYTNDENLGIAKNTRKLLSMCTGKYVSYIDGDDFFTDNKKIQKQVEFLESNTEYVMHSTGCFYADEEGQPSGVIISPLLQEPNYENLLHVNYVGFGRTFRNMPNISPEWMDDIKFHDWAMNFEISLRGKIMCDNSVTGGYRILGSGIITGLSSEQVHEHNQKCHQRLAERINDRHRPKAVVTGGCGFIGGHLVDRLIIDGYDVIVVDDLSSTDAEFHYNKSAKYFNIDVSSSNLPEDIFDGADFVFHLAAESRIQPAILNPYRAYTVNVIGTLNVVNMCIRMGVKRLIYSSTSSIYGLSDKMPSIESQHQDCLNPYSHSKMLGEEVLTHSNKINGLDCVTLRYFNVFGERAPIKGTYAPVVGVFLNDYINNEVLNIVGDGSKKRDFIHVLDVVEANILSARSTQKFNADVINIGTGNNYSIKCIADSISQNQNHIDDRIGEAKETLADINLATSRIGFMPNIDVIEWIKSKITNE